VPSDPGSPALHALADQLGTAGDADDEHWRWQVYQAAAARPELHAHLHDAVACEPDVVVAIGVALDLLERLAPDDAAAWLRGLEISEEGLVRRRAADTMTLRAVLTGSAASTPVEEWSDWLQRRVAAEATDPRVLDALVELGCTRRVRAGARVRFASLQNDRYTSPPLGRDRG
jgi:hypothetical protein